MNLTKKLAPILALAMVAAAVVAKSVATSRTTAARQHDHGAHLHQHPNLQAGIDSLALRANEDGFPKRKNGNGQWRSGGRAVAHRAGGIEIADASITSKAPDGRFYRLGINGWEPTIGVDDKGRIFYQARHANLEPHVVRSTNEGHTWRIVSPTIAGQPAQPISLDPILYLDKDTGRVFTNNIPPDITCQPISFSDNAGKTWTNTGICGHFDHQNIFTGPPPKDGDQPIGYPNVVYYCAINLVMLSGTSTATTCGRSLDGGLTWLPTGEPAYISPIGRGEGGLPWCDGAVGHGFVGDDGTVYLPRGWCGQPFLSMSKDEGLTWDQVQVAENGANGHEAGIAADSKRNLYFTWIGGDDLPYLAISRDGGKTWDDPMMIGPPGIQRSSLPAIDIGDDGKIAITYAGSETPGKKQKKWRWNGYITMTADALAKDPVFYTGTMNAPSDPLQIGECGDTRCHSLGDFFDVSIGPDGTPWVAFVDACWEKKCIPTFEAVGVRGEAVVGRLVGGPRLR
ncbi:MAG: sialidase family protein [Actinomycetota bacterium]